MIKKFQCHLSPFSDIISLLGLLKVMAECDDKDISVPPFLLNYVQSFRITLKNNLKLNYKNSNFSTFMMNILVVTKILHGAF